ncbi:MAG: hypothetical protein AAF587_32300 [Bacteroidota bacterium]
MENSFYFKPHLYLSVDAFENYSLDVIIPLDSGYNVFGSPVQEGDNWYITIVEDTGSKGGFYQTEINLGSQPPTEDTVSVSTKNNSGFQLGTFTVHYIDAEPANSSRSRSIAA